MPKAQGPIDPGGIDIDPNSIELPEAEHTGKLEAVARGGLQGVTFGTADEIGGALNALFSDRQSGEGAMDHYRRERDKIRTANDAAQASHPWLYGAGEVVGGIAPALASGGASAAAEGAGAAAEGVSALKAGWTAAKAGAGYGALSGLGTSKADLTQGDNVPNALYDTLKGAGFGAVTGGVLGTAGQAISNKLSGAADARVKSIYDGATRKTTPADQPRIASAFDNEKVSPAITDNGYHEDIGPSTTFKQVINKYANQLEGLRSEDPKVVAATAKRAKDLSWSLQEQKDPAYELLNKALDPEKGIGPTNNDMVKVIEKEASRYTPSSLEAKSLNKTADIVKEKLSTITSDEAKKALLNPALSPEDVTAVEALSKLKYVPAKGEAPGPERIAPIAQQEIDKIFAKYPNHKQVIELANSLPAGKDFTRDDLFQLALGEGKTMDKHAADLSDSVHDALKDLPFEYNPAARRPLQDHRAILTDAQNTAVDQLGGLNETQAHKLHQLAPEILDKSLKRAIGNANTSSAFDALARDNVLPGISQAAQTINDINLTQHTLLTLAGESPRLAQKLINSKDTLGSQLNQSAFDAVAAHALMAGNPAAIPAAYLAHKAPALIKGVRLASTDTAASIAQKLNGDTVLGYLSKRISGGRRLPDAVQDAIRAGVPRGAVTAALNQLQGSF